MPISMKELLIINIKLIFELDLKYTDSLEEGINNKFPCAHYTWYNRFSNQVSCLNLIIDHFPYVFLI